MSELTDAYEGGASIAREVVVGEPAHFYRNFYRTG